MMRTRLLQAITLATLVATALPVSAKKDFRPLLCLLRTVAQTDKAAGCTDYDWDKAQQTCNLQCPAQAAAQAQAATSNLAPTLKLGGGTVRKLSGEQLQKLQSDAAKH